MELQTISHNNLNDHYQNILRDKIEECVSTISQPWLKRLSKEYLHLLAKDYERRVIFSNTYVLRKLSFFLERERPDIKSIDKFDRVAAEEFLDNLCRSGISYHLYRNCVSNIMFFFQTLEDEGLSRPPRNVIIASDSERMVRDVPEFFSEREMRQIKEHIPDMLPPIAALTIILMEINIRIEDLCASKIMIRNESCLQMDADGNRRFSYYARDLRRVKSITVSSAVEEAIRSAIDFSRKRFGPSAKCVFSSSRKQYITAEHYYNSLQLAADRFDMTADNGYTLYVINRKFPHI